MAVREDVLKMKAAAPYLASTTREQRDAALEAVACALEAKADAVQIGARAAASSGWQASAPARLTMTPPPDDDSPTPILNS